jgi:integrase
MTMTTYGRLTPGKIGKLRLPKGKANLRIGDGGGLYLQITKAAKGGETRAWLFRFTSPVTARKRDMGLGELATVDLDKAREDARQARLLIRDGIDPIEARRTKKAEARAVTEKISFEEAAERFLKSHTLTWTNPVHIGQWRSTLGLKMAETEKERKRRKRAERKGEVPPAPKPPKGIMLPQRFIALRVDLITKTHVQDVLEPIWFKAPETASRLRGRMEKVLDWAKGRGYRTGDNPAAWKANVATVLPAIKKLKKPVSERRHAAMRYDDVPSFVRRLRAAETRMALFLETLILTAVRLGELRKARWGEFDLGAGIWTIPTAKAKHRKAPHRVALCPRVVEILEELGAGDKDPDALVFPSERKATISISQSALDRLVTRLADPLPDGRKVTLHGFRSSFSSFRAARTAFPADAAEAQLGHLLGRDDTERAYQRDDLLETRRGLMAAWERFCLTPPGEKGAVIPMRPIAEGRG